MRNNIKKQNYEKINDDGACGSGYFRRLIKKTRKLKLRPLSKVNEVIKGAWANTTYYSDPNATTAALEQTLAPGSKYTIADKITKTNPGADKAEFTSNYTIAAQTDAKNHISFKDQNNQDQDYEIGAITDQAMQLRQVKLKKEADYIEDGITKKAAKVIVTLTFNKVNTK